MAPTSQSASRSSRPAWRSMGAGRKIRELVRGWLIRTRGISPGPRAERSRPHRRRAADARLCATDNRDRRGSPAGVIALRLYSAARRRHGARIAARMRALSTVRSQRYSNDRASVAGAHGESFATWPIFPGLELLALLLDGEILSTPARLRQASRAAKAMTISSYGFHDLCFNPQHERTSRQSLRGSMPTRISQRCRPRYGRAGPDRRST